MYISKDAAASARRLFRRTDPRQSAAVAFVDWAIGAGKPIKGIRDVLIEMHVRVPTEAERFVALIPTIHRGVARQNRHQFVSVPA